MNELPVERSGPWLVERYGASMEPASGVFRHSLHSDEDSSERMILKNQQIIFDLLRHVDRKMDRAMADLAAISSKVSENGTVIASAVSLLDSLAAELAAIAASPPADQGPAIAALADQLGQNTDALAASVLVNTPAAALEPVPDVPPIPPVIDPPADAPLPTGDPVVDPAAPADPAAPVDPPADPRFA